MIYNFLESLITKSSRSIRKKRNNYWCCFLHWFWWRRFIFFDIIDVRHNERYRSDRWLCEVTFSFLLLHILRWLQILAQLLQFLVFTTAPFRWWSCCSMGNLRWFLDYGLKIGIMSVAWRKNQRSLRYVILKEMLAAVGSFCKHRVSSGTQRKN